MSLDYDELDKIINKYSKKKNWDKLPPKWEAVKEEKTEEKVEQKYSLDTIQEQMEAPKTTVNCPESIKEDKLKDIEKHPENYIEINFIKTVRLVDNFYIPSNLKKFHYKSIEYEIIEDRIYILPTKKDYFIPTCFFKEGMSNPVDFKNKNNGISGKALSLLYDVKLYMDLFSGEEGKYILFVVILTIISISCYLIGLYFILGGRIS